MGAGSLQLFKENHFDLVVSDHFLSGETGAILARELRLLKPTIPIVLLSGSIEPPEHSDVADAFIVKGDDPSLLLERVASVLKTASQSDDPEGHEKLVLAHFALPGRRSRLLSLRQRIGANESRGRMDPRRLEA